MSADSANEPDGPGNMPSADIDVDEHVVRRLLDWAIEHQGLDPAIADRDLEELTNGWDNVLYRLGADHVVRLPRRHAAVDLVAKEQRWLPDLAPSLPLPVPVPVFDGRPSPIFARPWSIVPWFDGEPFGVRATADLPTATADRLIADLANFLHRLHRPAPDDGPTSLHRGGPLTTRADRTEPLLTAGSPALDAVGSAAADRLRVVWRRALDQPAWSDGPRWLHGDLHPLNMVWHDDHLAAVIDFGDLCGGDPATDLAVAWHVFPDPDQRQAFRARARIDDAPIDDATWLRAAGWVLSISCAIAANSADHPMLADVSRRTLRTVAADPTLW